MSQPVEHRVESVRLIGLARDMLASAKDDSLAITYLDLALNVLADVPEAARVMQGPASDRG